MEPLHAKEGTSPVMQDAEPGVSERKRRMSTELSTNTAPARGLALASFDDAFRFAKMVASSDFAPKDFRGKPESCLLAMDYGDSIGLGRMQSLQSIAVINGRPSIWGDAALAVVCASQVCEYVIEQVDGDGESMVAVCEAKRRGYPKATVVRFSVADAKKASLWGKAGPWSNYPRRMLQLRARGFALRDAFPDVLKGLVTAEEAQDYATPTATVTQPERVAEPAKVKAASEADMQKARTAINKADDLGRLADFLATVNEREASGFYTQAQGGDLRNLIDVAIGVLNSKEEVTA